MGWGACWIVGDDFQGLKSKRRGNELIEKPTINWFPPPFALYYNCKHNRTNRNYRNAEFFITTGPGHCPQLDWRCCPAFRRDVECVLISKNPVWVPVGLGFHRKWLRLTPRRSPFHSGDMPFRIIFFWLYFHYL